MDLGGSTVSPRRVILLPTDAGQRQRLLENSRPRRSRRAGSNGRGSFRALACQKRKDLGYPHELWTTHARDHGPAAGHPSLSKLAQGTVRKILAEHAVKPQKLRYYLEKRDPG